MRNTVHKTPLRILEKHLPLFSYVNRRRYGPHTREHMHPFSPRDIMLFSVCYNLNSMRTDDDDLVNDCYLYFLRLSFLLQASDLADNVLVSIVEPLIKGDGAVAVSVHGGKVFLPLGKTSLH